MKMFLAGRAAESLVFGSVTNGASRRPALAWPISQVVLYGMSQCNALKIY